MMFVPDGSKFNVNKLNVTCYVVSINLTLAIQLMKGLLSFIGRDSLESV